MPASENEFEYQSGDLEEYVLKAMVSVQRNEEAAFRPLRIDDLGLSKEEVASRRKRCDESIGQRYLNSVITARLI